MSDDQNSEAQCQRSTGRVIGSAVVAGMASGLFAVAVSAFAGSALAAVLRRRLAPPSAMARQNWARAKAATSAGLGAWRDEQPVTQP